MHSSSKMSKQYSFSCLHWTLTLCFLLPMAMFTCITFHIITQCTTFLLQYSLFKKDSLLCLLCVVTTKYYKASCSSPLDHNTLQSWPNLPEIFLDIISAPHPATFLIAFPLSAASGWYSLENHQIPPAGKSQQYFAVGSPFMMTTCCFENCDFAQREISMTIECFLLKSNIKQIIIIIVLQVRQHWQ